MGLALRVGCLTTAFIAVVILTTRLDVLHTRLVAEASGAAASPDDLRKVMEINIVDLPSNLSRERVIDLVGAITDRTGIDVVFVEDLGSGTSGLKVSGKAAGDHTAYILIKEVLSMEISILHEVAHLVNEGRRHEKPWCDTFWNSLQKMIPDQYSLWTQYNKMKGGYGCTLPYWE
jgi:hypothetical protein